MISHNIILIKYILEFTVFITFSPTMSKDFNNTNASARPTTSSVLCIFSVESYHQANVGLKFDNISHFLNTIYFGSSPNVLFLYLTSLLLSMK
jgi:hypothetical protein